jgi:hypothetical protein
LGDFSFVTDLLGSAQLGFRAIILKTLVPLFKKVVALQMVKLKGSKNSNVSFLVNFPPVELETSFLGGALQCIALSVTSAIVFVLLRTSNFFRICERNFFINPNNQKKKE